MKVTLELVKDYPGSHDLPPDSVTIDEEFVEVKDKKEIEEIVFDKFVYALERKWYRVVATDENGEEIGQWP